MGYNIIKRQTGFSPHYFLLPGVKRDVLNNIFRDISTFYQSDVDEYDFFPKPCFDFSETALFHKVLNEMTASELYNCMIAYCEFCYILRDMCDIGLIDVTELKKIRITSQFRNSKVNRMVGGVDASLHQFGLAIDFTAPSHILNAFFMYVVNEYLKTDAHMFNHRWNQKLFLHPCEIIRYYMQKDENNSNRIHIAFKYVELQTKQNEIPF